MFVATFCTLFWFHVYVHFLPVGTRHIIKLYKTIGTNLYLSIMDVILCNEIPSRRFPVEVIDGDKVMDNTRTACHAPL